MLFSVIYSVDVPADENVNDFGPLKLDDLWDPTEAIMSNSTVIWKAVGKMDHIESGVLSLPVSNSMSS